MSKEAVHHHTSTKLCGEVMDVVLYLLVLALLIHFVEYFVREKGNLRCKGLDKVEIEDSVQDFPLHFPHLILAQDESFSNSSFWILCLILCFCEVRQFLTRQQILHKIRMY